MHESMTEFRERTLRSPVACTGVGLHSGIPVHLTLRPATAGSGVVFIRTDLSPAVEISARPENVVDTAFATTLGIGDARVGTVEHLMAALCGMGIDNARVEVDGPEIPVMDGSAAPFIYLIRTAGIAMQRRFKRFLVVRRPIEVRDGEKRARILPSTQLAVSCTIDFDHPLIKDQSLHVELSDKVFYRDIARARTFGFLKEVESLKKRGLAQGGSLENAIVVDEFSVLNAEGLRYPDEFVRHKILDIIGDLALCRMPVVGHFVSYKSGHSLNQRLVSRLNQQAIESGAAEIVEVREERQLEKFSIAPPAFGLPEGQPA
jgi:UDP-3-O-[3-hydroxymyristoyl] N-acetylglucosamine deacetylase